MISGRIRVGMLTPVALLLSAVPATAEAPLVSSGCVTHVRWVITAVRDGAQDEGFVQAAEIVLLKDGEPLPNTSEDPSITVTNPGGDSPEWEEPDQVYDGLVDTKWLDYEFRANGGTVLVIEFPRPVEFDGYRWVTGDDLPARDPVTWRLEVSADGDAWTIVDTRTAQDVTTDRKALVGPFDVGPSGSDGCGTGPVAPVAATPPAISCGPEAPSVGAVVTCNVSGGDPGIVILWRAAFNPAFAGAGVTLDADGTGTFLFVVPTAAFGRELTVELVEWAAPVTLGVVGAPLPGSIPAGGGREGGVPTHAWSLVLAALLAFGLLRRRTYAEG